MEQSIEYKPLLKSLINNIFQLTVATLISFTLFLFIPIAVITLLSTSDTIPVWFFLFQMFMFVYMTFEGLPAIWKYIASQIL